MNHICRVGGQKIPSGADRVAFWNHIYRTAPQKEGLKIRTSDVHDSSTTEVKIPTNIALIHESPRKAHFSLDTLRLPNHARINDLFHLLDGRVEAARL